ncbi:MAG TPA: hypothetical protein VHT34_02055 [Clostridia bacterium]|nr:hypothetical protein [Clostridia bacterium]
MEKDLERIIVLFEKEYISETTDPGNVHIIRGNYDTRLKNDLQIISQKYSISSPIQIAEWLDYLNVAGCVISWSEQSDEINREIKIALRLLNYVAAIYPDNHYSEKKGDWFLRVYYRVKGTRSEGTQGFLFFQEKPITGKHVGEELETDLGLMKYYGEFSKDVIHLWDPSGWNYADRTLIKSSLKREKGHASMIDDFNGRMDTFVNRET